MAFNKEYFFPEQESWRESLPAFLIFLGAAIFVLFLGFGKVFISIGAIVLCTGLVSKLILQGPKSFLLSTAPALALLLRPFR